MKKFILIYIIGVAISWGMGLNNIKSYKKCIDYGDITFISIMATFSWINVASLSIIKFQKSEFFDNKVDFLNEDNC